MFLFLKSPIRGSSITSEKTGLTKIDDR